MNIHTPNLSLDFPSSRRASLRRIASGHAGLALILTLLVLTVGAAPALAAEGVVNINTADEDQLALLPRIGPSIAGRIAEHRETNGEFAEPEELMLVRGIGEKTFELLEPWIVVEGDSTLSDKVRTSEARERLEQGESRNR